MGLMNENGLKETPDGKKYDCRNISVNPGDAEEYDEILRNFSSKIYSFKTQIKQRFSEDDGTSKTYSTRGSKVDVKRLARHQAGAGSDKIFRNRDKGVNKADMCIGILINESDQLGDDEKVDNVKKGVITLAEGCAKVGVPCYVMGYSANNGTIDHNHYVSWDNTNEERLSLLNLKRNDGSFDGYSIRYFVDEILSTRKEEHKIVMVISGGLPTQSFAGIDYKEDLKQVISKYRKKGVDFVGIFIGNKDESVEEIYGIKNIAFISEDKSSDAFPNIMIKNVLDIVKGWK